MQACKLLITCVGVSCLVWGCSVGDDYREFTPTDDVTNTTPPEVHEHASGPNGGHLIELGEEEYHAEVVMDEAAHTLTVYLLGSDAKTAQPIADSAVTLNLDVAGATTEFTLSAASSEGDPEGQASRFQLSEGLPETIHDAEDLHGSVSVSINGQAYTGAIEHDHDHGHDHDDHGHADGHN